MRIVWLHGPPGVGKSTTAWALLNRLNAVGERTAHVDIDQLKMLYPAPEDDPDADRLAGDALRAVSEVFDSSGAEVLVVSGVMDPTWWRYYQDVLASFPLFLVRLVVPDDELLRRLADRGVGADERMAALEDAREHASASVEHMTVVSAGQPPAGVARDIHGELPRRSSTPAQGARGALGTSVPSGGRAVLVSGCRGVGKSTAAWTAFVEMRRRGVRVAFIDLRQLGLIGLDGGPLDHRLQSGALASVWNVFRTAGAEILILNGTTATQGDVQLYRSALSATPMASVRLVASSSALVERLSERARGEGVRLAGDDIVGLGRTAIRDLVAESQRLEDRRSPADRERLIDTTRLTVGDAARDVLESLDDV